MDANAKDFLVNARSVAGAHWFDGWSDEQFREHWAEVQYAADLMLVEAERRGLVAYDANGNPSLPFDVPEGVPAVETVLTRGRNDWRPMETAPKDGTPIQVEIPGYGADYIIRWQDGFIDHDGEDSGAWVVAEDQEPPECWTDGVCWWRNEDSVPSVWPTRWKPRPMSVPAP